jgi:N-acetylglucosaminyl-diphospho-decaprenol L-rhamnosyltransferase
MKLSIIYVNYKSYQLLRQSIKSLKYTNFPLEIIVADNSPNSSDMEIVSKNKNMKTIPLGDHYGFAKACNTGAQKSTGDYLFFLNPDTCIFDNTIEILTDVLNKEPSAAAVSPRIWWDKERTMLLPPLDVNSVTDWTCYQLSSKGNYYELFLKKYVREIIDYWNADGLFQTKTVPGAAFMIRREIFFNIGMFDENFQLYFEDNDISKRLIDCGCKLYLVPDAGIAHLYNQSARLVRRKAERLFEESRQLYFRKHFPDFSNDFFDSINKYISSLNNKIPEHDIMKTKKAPVFISDYSADVVFLFSVNHFFHPSAGTFLKCCNFILNTKIWNRLSTGIYWAGFFSYPEIQPIKIWRINKE